MDTRTLKCGKEIPAIGMEGSQADEENKSQTCKGCDNHECDGYIAAKDFITVKANAIMIGITGGAMMPSHSVKAWRISEREDTAIVKYREKIYSVNKRNIEE